MSTDEKLFLQEEAMMEELIRLVDRYHPHGAATVLSVLTGVLVSFAHDHGVPREQVCEAVRGSYDSLEGERSASAKN